jgi:hypothetical protein
MTAILFAIACSYEAPTVLTDASFDSYGDLTDGTLSGDPIPTSAGRITLDVELADDATGIVELRPYRGPREAATWVGRALTLSPESTDSVSVPLPTLPPRRDRVSATEPVVYAIALRDVADDGAAAAYIGVSELELVWSPDHEDGPGWWLVEDFGGEGETWHDFTEPVSLGDQLLGEHELEMGGFAGLPDIADTHLTVTTSDFSEGVSVYDAPLSPGDDWSADVAFAGRLRDAGYDDGAFLHVVAYVDSDGDSALTAEPLLGRACFGSAEALVTWFPQPRDLRAALELDAKDLVGGWGVQISEGDKMDPLSPDLYGEIALLESCAPPAGLPDGEE